MPITPTYPGVYVEEIPSGVRTITGVATSITAFIGRALRGPVDEAIRIQSFADFARVFGGLWAESPMSYAVQQFFQHGGSDAIVIRVFNSADPAADTATIPLPTGALTLEAAGPALGGNVPGPGAWGNALRATVDHDTATGDADLFNLLIEELEAPGSTVVKSSETFLNVSSTAGAPRDVVTVLLQSSSLVRVRGAVAARPDVGTTDADGGGSNGNPIDDNDILGDAAARTGLFALEGVDLFNLLCIPPLARDTDVGDAVWTAASSYCQDQRAVLVIDPPQAWTANPATAIATAEAGVSALRTAVGDAADHSVAYFPRLLMADALSENRTAEFAPCGAVAGIIARTDVDRGVWKAPAGLDASFSGVRGFSYRMTDDENGRLNPLGLNALRSFPVTGNVVWGARTLAGADRLASEWKYLPVRRTALYIEESLYRGLQWVVFEPNDESLWAQIRLNVGAFMQNLFRQGAFQGTTPREAYLVKCDSETTTQNDIDRGIVNILIGFAPLKPAEFVMLQIQQLAGQIEV